MCVTRKMSFISFPRESPSSSGAGQGDLLMIQLWLAFIPLEAGIFYPRWKCDYTQVGFPLARPVCVCSATGPIFLFSSSSLQVWRKELAGGEDYKIFHADRCSGLTEDPWANAYVLGRKLKLLLRL